MSKKLSWRRLERKTIVAWIRFARRHQDSRRLPFALFALIFLDGFVVFIPSVVLAVASTTISPRRWYVFALVFALASTANNAVTYWLGKSLPLETIMSGISMFHLEILWQSAQSALQKYGSYATIFGAIIGLPTQLITALIGISDVGVIREGPSPFLSAIGFAALGHTIKGSIVTGITRIGWIKIKKRFDPENS